MGTPFDITSFDLKNTNGKAVVYRASDPSLNLLTFTIINTTKADLPLTGGAPNLGSTFTIDFSSILPDPIVEGLAIALPTGWAALFEAGTETDPPAWALAPEGDVTLKADESVKFKISNIVLDSYNAGNFEIQWSNIPGQRDSISALTIWLGVINPPDPKKKDLVLHSSYNKVTHSINNVGGPKSEEVIDVADGTPVPVFITYDNTALIFNAFTYNLTNPSDESIPASTVIGAGTVLSISFLVGELSYDITTPDRAANRMAIVVTSNKPPWKPDRKTSSSGLITFRLRPESNVFLGGRQTLSLDVQAIVTALNVAPGTISTMYAQINNVPGYNDAVFFLALEKKVAKAKAVIFGAVPTTINYGQNVTLSWETELAKRVTIKYKDRNGKQIILDSDKGEIPLNSNGFSPPAPPSAAHTVLFLSAYDNSPTPSQLDRSVTVIQPPPAILSFLSDRSLVGIITGKPDITLSWTLNEDVRKLMLDAPDGTHDVTGKPSYPYKLTASTVFKLHAYGYDPDHPDPVVSRTTVFGYVPGASMGMEFTGVAMQNWPVVLASRVNNCLFALDAGADRVYQFDASKGTQLGTYEGSVMALSPKETKLFVCTKDRAVLRSVVLMVDLSSGVRGAAILAGAVRTVVCNGSDTLLCCAMTDGMRVARIAISPREGFGFPTYIPVGATPISMVFNDDSSMLYVANYASNSISLVRLSDNSVTNAKLTTSKPNSMVYQNGRLFVACEGEDKVAMIDLSNNAVTYITTGPRPSQLLFHPKSEKLYVANFGGNTVSVIDTRSGLVEASLPVGEGPIGMALNELCNVLFVCNYCSCTLSVIELPGKVLPEQLSTGKGSGNPFGVVCWEGKREVKIFVGKENYPERRKCSAPTPNTSLSVAVYSIEKPPGMPGDL
jgi:YVTN family beta-propeller protein